ncbi:MAG: TatD family hydrolase [Acidimicrobiia bacterium]
MSAAGAVQWFESHCHLDSLEDPSGAVDRARDAGVGEIIAIGDDLPTSFAAISLAHAHDRVWATAGIHPHEAAKRVEQWEGILDCHKDQRVVAVGETGLDYYYEHSPRDAQQESFREHIRLAARLDRALVVHSRDAWDDLWRIVDEEIMPSRVVIHCFTGGPAEAVAAIDRGFFIGVSGIVTFKNAGELRDAVAATPIERILLETDSPFLAPMPHRGRKNEPAFVSLVGQAVAALKDIAVEELQRITSENARQLYALTP